MEFGTLVEICPRKQYDYSFLEGSGSSEIVLTRTLEVVPDYRFKLITLVHDAQFATASGATVRVQVASAMPSPTENALFTAAPTLTTTIDLNTDPGDMLVEDGTDIGPYANVTLRFDQIDTGERLFVDLSFFALLRAGG